MKTETPPKTPGDEAASLPRLVRFYDYGEVDELSEEWIECSDGLPPPGKEVIVETAKGVVTALARYLRYEGCLPEQGWWDNGYGGNNMHVFAAVVRWRPLPKSNAKVQVVPGAKSETDTNHGN